MNFFSRTLFRIAIVCSLSFFILNFAVSLSLSQIEWTVQCSSSLCVWFLLLLFSFGFFRVAHTVFSLLDSRVWLDILFYACLAQLNVCFFFVVDAFNVCFRNAFKWICNLLNTLRSLRTVLVDLQSCALHPAMRNRFAWTAAAHIIMCTSKNCLSSDSFPKEKLFLCTISISNWLSNLICKL